MSESSSAWVRGRSRRVQERHESKGFSKGMSGVLLAVLVLAVGLIYVSQGTKATGYDYEISKVDEEIAELSARRDDLQVERARLTSMAYETESEVAANMEVASVTGYAE